MFSTVRAKEFGSITRSKKEIGVSARDAKMGLLKEKNQTYINTNFKSQYSF